MKRKNLLTAILFAFCGVGMLTLQSSSVPEVNFSYAKVQWFNNIHATAQVSISGYLYETGAQASEAFEATYDGAQGNVNLWKIYALQHAYDHGTVTLDYDYYSYGILIHYHFWYDFSKTTQETFDYQIPVPISGYAEAEAPIEDPNGGGE